MKRIPHLQSKLTVPELPGKVIFSMRLKGLPIAGKRAVLVTAPGGFGKTTAVLLALKKERQHIHWYRTEKEDSFLPVFYTHLIETLFAGIDKLELDCYRGLSSVSNITEDYTLLNALICQDAWQYFSKPVPYHYLVIDDFHNVVDNPLIPETIRYFVDNMPPGIGLIIISRVETGIYSGRITLNPNVTLIDKDDLRFTRAETDKLLLKTYQTNFNAGELDRIHEYVEGWIAGLILISRIDYPRQFLFDAPLQSDHASEQTLFNHFFGEYLQGMELHRLQALAEMSIFFEFSCDDLREVLGIENAPELLAWLERSNIYIQKFMTYPVKYRFHSLFRRELEIYLKRIRSHTCIRALQARAAQHYERTGDMRSAVSFYLAAGQTEKAVGIMSVAGAELFARGEPEKIMYLVKEFPEETVQADPYLLFFRGLMLRTSDVTEAYNCFKSALVMLKNRNDMSYLMNAFGMILVIAFETNNFIYVEDIVSAIPKLKVMFSSPVPRTKLLISGFINLVADEKFKPGLLACKIIERISITEPIWEYSFLMIRGILLYRTGRLKSASEGLPKILNHPIGLASDQWRFIGLVSCHNTLWLQRDLKASNKIMEEFAELGEKYDSDFFRSFAYRLSAIMKFQTRDITGAMADMEETANCYVRYGSPILASAAMITKYLWEAEISAAKDLIDKAEVEFLNIPRQNAGHGYYELCQGMMGALYKAAGDYDRSERYLLSAYRESHKKKARQHECAMAMHLADLYYKRDKLKLFHKYLGIWAKNSSSNGYVFFHEMEYITLVTACALAMGKRLFPEHMKKIIDLCFGPGHGKRMADNPSLAFSDPRGFIRGCTGPLKKEETVTVTLFGSFSIQKGAVTIGENEWKTRKVSGILKYILANDGKSVTRESLAAAFWPDSDSRAAYTSLRVALYEMRKSLARFGMGFNDKSTLIIEDKSGFRLNNPNQVKTDVHEFKELYKRYRTQALPEKQGVELLSRMISLYTGDFLMGGVHDDEWVYLSRERYKAMFIEASQALSRIMINKGALKEAEAILEKHMNIEPLCENGCSLLVSVYKKTGQTARAGSLIRQFKKRFESEMGVKPDLDH